MPNKYKRAKRMSKGSTKSIVQSVAIALILIVTISGTIAFLTTKTNSITNIFKPTTAEPTIEETFENNIKSDVKVSISGDPEVSSYVRARIIFSWENSDGEVAAEAVSKSDYTLDLGNSWTKASDGYYYYNGTVKGGASTSNLIDTCTANKTLGDYHLCVEILAQSIQSDPATAVQSAWGMTYSNGAWSTYTTDGTN